MPETYHIARREAGEPTIWEDLPQAPINHYLWADNGYCPQAFARVCYTADALQVLLCAVEREARAACRVVNGPVYRDSCLEFFMQPLPGQDARYLNFEFNSLGTPLLGIGAGRNDRAPIDADSIGQLRIRPFSKVTDGKTTWGVEFSVPLPFLGRLFPEFFPAKGARMKGNFYKCGDDTPRPHFGCWNPIASSIPDFHKPEFFGEFILD